MLLKENKGVFITSHHPPSITTKRQILMIMATHVERDIGGDIAMQPKGKLNLDMMAQ